MKKLSNLLIALALMSTFFIACEEDPVIPPAAESPTVAISAGSPVSAATDVAVNTEFIVAITAQAGTEDMSQIAVLEDGTAIDASRVTLEGNAAGSNPSPIGATFASSLSWDVGITTTDEADVIKTYTIRITDAGGLTDEVSVDITQISTVSELTMKLLKNQGGPAGTGGIDLDTGEGTGTRLVDNDSSYLQADLRDQGNDANFVWIQKIAGINNSQLAVPAAGFDYDAVAAVSQIVTAFEAGTVVAESEVVAIGDVFIVKNELGKHFAIKITDVVATPDIGDNTDYYELSVKQ